MRASDIVERLRTELPKRTDLFSNQISVSSLTSVGLTATAVTTTPHGLTNGAMAVIKGAREKNIISSLTSLDGIATAVTANDHKLTMPTSSMVQYGRLYDFNYAAISGAVESEYDGDKLLTSVPNRKTFKYAVSGTPASPATGTIVLEQVATPYNGIFPITVVDATTFTYAIPSPAGIATGTITAQGGFRISSAVSFAQWERAYTRQDLQKYWAVVQLGDVTASKDRNVLGDSTFLESRQSSFRCRLIEPFRIFVVAPSKDTYSGRPIQDEMETIRGYIYNSLAGYIFPSALSEAPFSKTAPTGDRYAAELSNDAKYVHEFLFERSVDVAYDDTIGPPETVPFRDIFVTSQSDIGTGELESSVNLDDSPL